MSKKKITITVNKRQGDEAPSFTLDSNMERYEILGILELASEKIKQICMKENRS